MWFVVNREDLDDWPQPQRGDLERFLEEQCELVRPFPVRWTPRNHDVQVYVRL
jgi:hypothetical protein